ncbi:MAG: hypothetical protein KAT70_04320, partial [Thermoplasmata archaeon]|nr:hypothetical protein [Thermoplasmata archaeon]
EEGKAKMASQDDIVLESLRALGPRKLEYTRVLVIAGPTREPVDSMRTLTNRSTGRTGRELAREAYRMGADVMLWLGGDARAPNIPSERFGTAESLKKLVEYDGGGWDIILVPAAIADYSPVREDGKIPSGHGSLSLELRRVDKLLPLLRKKTRFLVGFKAETHVGRDELILRARKRMEEAGADMMIANCLEDVSLEETSVLLVRKDSVIPYEGRKGKVARAIMAEVGALAKG